MEIELLQEIHQKVEQGEKVALAIITSNNGSIPGKLGALMAVFQDGTSKGTIGGGKVENEIINKSKQALEKGENFPFSHDMGDKEGLACGGVVEGFVKVFMPRKKLVIFGSGHVGRQLALSAKNLDFDIYVVDDRGEYKELEAFKDIKEYLTCDIKNIKDYILFDENTYVVATTRSHTFDSQVVECVGNIKMAYFGMIGSKKKVIKVLKENEEKGILKENLDKIYAPIGLNIANGTPEEIAISIISEIIMVKNGLNSESLKINVK